MKCQILFSGENKKNISICCLLKILPRVLSVNLDLAADDNLVDESFSFIFFPENPVWCQIVL